MHRLDGLIENRLQIYVAALAIVRPQLATGKIKIVALMNREHVSILPNVPTVEEAGFPALSLEGLVGLFGPRGCRPSCANGCGGYSSRFG